MRVLAVFACALCAASSFAQKQMTVDLSGMRSGPVAVTHDAGSLRVDWSDNAAQRWEARFSLDPAKPLIASIAVAGRDVITQANPVYRCVLGKRKGGWDAFFDDPADDPGGATRFVQQFHPLKTTARTVGDRVEVDFDGLRMGSFSGAIRYTFYPGTSLVQQAVVASTSEKDVAYFYDAGLSMLSEQDRAPGLNMSTAIVSYDPEGKLETTHAPYGSERHTMQVRYRVLATKAGAGSIAVFPSPHRYLFARDYSTNLGFNWYSAWRGHVELGIQQPFDDNTKIYPWMNAPPHTEQEMGVFLQLSAGAPTDALAKVLAYTHGDRFVHLPGYVTFAPHWHFAYTVQAQAHGLAWQPPFVAAFRQTGVDSALIFDFHIDGHPGSLENVRLEELNAFYKAARLHSDKSFLLIPGEEADVYLGGHYGLVFPKPVYWFEKRGAGDAFEAKDAKFGTVYHVSSADELWKLVIARDGFVYQTHPRTKGSTGYPDAIESTSYFRDPRYFGVGWKAMPSDLSSPRLGERGFKTLDDLNNAGLHKHMVGEDDLFQIHTTDELYSQMNIDYVKLAALPDFDHYGKLIEAVAKGDDFISTGEVLLPSVAITGGEGDTVRVHARVSSTFPLRMAEIVWGDGRQTHHEVIDLSATHAFEDRSYDWTVHTPGWTWARVAVWDIAADGGFTNPVWRDAVR